MWENCRSRKKHIWKSRMFRVFGKNRQCFHPHQEKSMAYVRATCLRKGKDVKQICHKSGPGAKSGEVQPKSVKRPNTPTPHTLPKHRKGVKINDFFYTTKFFSNLLSSITLEVSGWYIDHFEDCSFSSWVR